MRRHIRNIMGIMLAAVMLTTVPLTVYAEEAATNPVAMTGADEKLMDNVLEYSEIPALVHHFNPMMAANWKSYNDGVVTLKDSLSEVRAILKDTNEKLAAAKATAAANPMDINARMLAMTYEYSVQALTPTQAMLEKQYDTMSRDKNSITKALYQGEEQLVNGVQLLMIAYQTMETQKAMLTELTQLYEQSCQAAQTMLAQGMGTYADLSSAQTNLMSAKSNLSKLTAGEQQIYNQLITLCGWKSGDAVVIGAVPAPDPNALAAMNPEADLAAAIGNNHSYAALRKSGAGNKASVRRKADISEETARNNIRMNLTALYNDAVSAKAAWDAANVGYQAALASKTAADKQMELGLVSKVQYLGLCVVCAQKKAAYESAALALTQAINAYQFAVAGNCSIE